MAPTKSLWNVPYLQRYRFPIIAVACLAAGATIYYVQNLQSLSRSLPESTSGLHRSNAGRRRRQRRSTGAVPESEGHEALRENSNTANLTNRPPLGVAETDTDAVSEYSWEEQDEWKEKEGQSLLLLLYKIAEELSRRDGYVHRGVTCNSCNENPIKGIRYRCANCADYDLCETCESAHAHNRQHLFWKIRIPAPHIGGSRKERQPLFYPGKPKAIIQDLQREKVEDFCKDTGYKAEEVEAFWEQFRSMAATEWPHDPDHYGLAIDRIAFDKCFVPSSSSRPAAPNLLYNRIFSYYDTNDDGLIGFGEFIRGLASLKKKNVTERLRRVFKAYDINGDGYVDRRDFLRIFRAYYGLTKDLMSDIVAGMQDEEDQDARELVTSSQPISAGFNGPGVMQRDRRRHDDTGKVRNNFGDLEIVDGMGVVEERRYDPELELSSMIGENTELARWVLRESPLPRTSPSVTGQTIYCLVNHATQEDVGKMLNYYGKYEFPSESDSNEQAWSLLRRELHGKLAAELRRRRSVRRDAVIQRLRRQSFYQDSDTTWLSVDIVALPDAGGTHIDPRFHTQMEKDLRDLESSGLDDALKKALYRLIQSYNWPIDDIWGFENVVFGMIREGWTLEELDQGLDGYSSESSEVFAFVRILAQVLAEMAGLARDDPEFHSNYPVLRSPSKSERLRLWDKQWSCPKGVKLEPNNGQDVLLKVTEEALNELLDPVFKLREDLALQAMFESPRRRRYRNKIIDAMSSHGNLVGLKQSFEYYCRRWRQQNDRPPPPGDTRGENEAEVFADFLEEMKSGRVSKLNGSKCLECLAHGRESWVRIGEFCSQRGLHVREPSTQPEGRRLDKERESPLVKCQTCTKRGVDSLVSPLFCCDRCGEPTFLFKREERRILHCIKTGGQSLSLGSEASSENATTFDEARPSLDEPCQDISEAAESSDEDHTKQESVSPSENNDMFSSEPGSPGSLCDSIPLEFDDADENPEAFKNHKNAAKPLTKVHDLNSPGSLLNGNGLFEAEGPNALQINGELVSESDHASVGSPSFSPIPKPDPTLPQHRPTAVSSHMPLQSPSSSVSLTPNPRSSVEAGKPAERFTDWPSLKEQYEELDAPSDARLELYACLDMLEADEKERGGPGRINFDEFEEIMLGDKGPRLGFLASWVEIGAF